MDIKSLSVEDQALLNTQFDPELEKQASEQVKLASELYTTGHDKLAAETADLLEKIAEEESKEEEEKEKHEGKELNEEQKKEASVRGAFIAQGFIDGLKKLGSERYQDEMAYLMPFVNEKIANMLPAVIPKPGLGSAALELAKKHGPAAAVGGAVGVMAGRASKKD